MWEERSKILGTVPAFKVCYSSCKNECGRCPAVQDWLTLTGQVMGLEEGLVWTRGQSAWEGLLLGAVCVISGSHAKVDKLICLHKKDKGRDVLEWVFKFWSRVLLSVWTVFAIIRWNFLHKAQSSQWGGTSTLHTLTHTIFTATQVGRYIRLHVVQASPRSLWMDRLRILYLQGSKACGFPIMLSCLNSWVP